MDNEAKAQAIIQSAFPNLWVIKELMDEVGIVEIDIVKALYSIKNIQNMSKYGKVTINIKDGEIISISGESSFITESELMRNLKKYENRKINVIVNREAP